MAKVCSAEILQDGNLEIRQNRRQDSITCFKITKARRSVVVACMVSVYVVYDAQSQPRLVPQL